MKKKIQYVAAIAILAIQSFSTSVLAQPDPGSGGDPGGGAPSIGAAGGGGGAPVGDGVFILIIFALVYGISRYNIIHKQKMMQKLKA